MREKTRIHFQRRRAECFEIADMCRIFSSSPPQRAKGKIEQRGTVERAQGPPGSNPATYTVALGKSLNLFKTQFLYL